ncbi:hypothetical protein EVG20_g7728 [Dentipellis fragilis]|uniref:Cytochrome b-c1 complex subunit 8 n=1 Tax=Dentipellis fragilis TaxID=205917 RepID=A0A4Y9YDS9_9AGAM|nr:hypothetical protein EVG20_g7728 [Dentipellis fragilis]
MRATGVRMSEMPGPKVYNIWWGDKHGAQRQRGIVQYGVSPFRQRSTHHMFRHYLFNGYRRLASQVPYWIVPVSLGYGLYTWANAHYAWQGSKAGHLASGEHH